MQLSSHLPLIPLNNILIVCILLGAVFVVIWYLLGGQKSETPEPKPFIDSTIPLLEAEPIEESAIEEISESDISGGSDEEVAEETEVPPVEDEEIQPPIEEVREISVSGTEFSFSPATLSFTSGEKIRLTFNNTGSAPHNLIIEGTEIGTKTISGGKENIIEFVAPASGTYAIFCSVGSHRQLGMEGTVTVE